MPKGRLVATQRALGTNTGKVDTSSFTWRTLQTLCWKAGLLLVEEVPSVTTRTFALYAREPVVAYSPTSDLHVALQEKGEAPITENVHELSPLLERQRESAGITADEDES